MNGQMPISLDYHLRRAAAEPDLRHLIAYLARAGKYIVREVWAGSIEKTTRRNQFGDELVELDVLANEILEQHMRENELVACYASEEKEQIVELHPGAPYALVFDPLDGSSLVDVNFAIGTIVGIYRGKEILGRRPREQVAALYILYGPRTTLTYSTGPAHGVHEFVLNEIGEFVLHREKLAVKPDAKTYAPGNIGAAAEVSWYRKVIDSWIRDKKTLRYSGGMVPDIHHILAKGDGIFCNIGGGKYPQGKLRLPFECGPFAYLVEAAGGLSSDGRRSILDIAIDRIDQRTQFIVGSRNEVRRIEEMVAGGSSS
jgi:fructose-1,6-bisphosphatase I